MNALKNESDKIFGYLKNNDFDQLDQIFTLTNNKDIRYWTFIKEELKKNEYTDKQYMAIAQFLYRLFNIAKIDIKTVQYHNGFPGSLQNYHR